MMIDIAELIDLPHLERLMRSLHKATGMPYALIDNQNNVLVGVGWRDICTKFHSQKPVTCGRCSESDQYIPRHLEHGSYIGYRCPQGVMDYATPLIIEGEHLADIFTGQVLNAPPSIDFLEKQAEQFGFDKHSYMETLKNVPIVSEEKIEGVMGFLVELAKMLAVNGLNRLRQIKAAQDLLALNEGLIQIVEERTGELSNTNDQLQEKVKEHKRAENALAAASAELRNKISEIIALREQVRQLAIHDPLTGLYNRRFLDETLPRMLSQAERLNYPVTVAMADVDHFKELNDLHGHQAGDALLRRIAEILKSSARIGDIACRYGGEEFLFIFPGMPDEIAAARLEQVREDIARVCVKLGQQELGRTISIGIASYPKHASTWQDLIGEADKALYRAKHLGRNRVITCQPMVPGVNMESAARIALRTII